MLGYGALNGTTMNNLPMNSGTWLMLNSASSLLAVVSDFAMTRRVAPTAVSLIALTTESDLRRRAAATAATVVAVSSAVNAVRRVVHQAQSEMRLPTLLVLTRRLTHAPQTAFEIVGRARAAWRSLRPTEPARTLRFYDLRRVMIIDDQRTVAMAREPRQVHVPRGREDAP